MGDLLQRIAKALKKDDCNLGVSARVLLPMCARELERLEHELHRTNDAIHVIRERAKRAKDWIAGRKAE